MVLLILLEISTSIFPPRKKILFLIWCNPDIFQKVPDIDQIGKEKGERIGYLDYDLRN